MGTFSMSKKIISSNGISERNNKKCPALSFEGYSYRFDKFVSANTEKRWRCRTRDCNGCMYSINDPENSDIQIRTPHREHCIPDSDARAIELVVSDLKMKARTQLTPIPMLYGDAAATLSVNPSIASRFPLFGQSILLCIERD
ncbi:hypothetical protein LOD99_1715 [Oopsacas minuta]|uniref:FLYWCH-type domain-containing protein n=1 Tax=Oopsacas minuta TaxID=111878 RepID=A0AAV7K4Y6_9METZ|nr:hypothetical protein LOD99_1715 [Oopsacas minuta]